MTSHHISPINSKENRDSSISSKMRNPTAPMLQAEYHNYNEQNTFNDYYGGYEPKTPAGWNGSGPRRMDNTEKKNERCTQGQATVHCVNVLILARSILVLVILGILFNSGYTHEYVFWMACFECFCVLASIGMCCGVHHGQPFFCILFTVLRTMEAFGALVLLVAAVWSLADRRSDPARSIRDLTRQIGGQYGPGNISWDDASLYVSALLAFVSLLLLAFSFWICRVSWVATMKAADERRKIQTTRNHEVSRVMVASDELYTNY